MYMYIVRTRVHYFTAHNTDTRGSYLVMQPFVKLSEQHTAFHSLYTNYVHCTCIRVYMHTHTHTHTWSERLSSSACRRRSSSSVTFSAWPRPSPPEPFAAFFALCRSVSNLLEWSWASCRVLLLEASSVVREAFSWTLCG